MSPWVAYVPDSRSVPSPTKFLGHIAGAAGELSSTARIYGYFRALAAASPRVRVEVIGRSDEGRDILLVAVADEDGIRNLASLKAATAALADPRTTTPGQAERVIQSARPIYPLAVATRHRVELNTWDRTVINLPFTRAAAVVGRTSTARTQRGSVNGMSAVGRHQTS